MDARVEKRRCCCEDDLEVEDVLRFLEEENIF
jgi:hypothetical protein